MERCFRLPLRRHDPDLLYLFAERQDEAALDLIQQVRRVGHLQEYDVEAVPVQRLSLPVEQLYSVIAFQCSTTIRITH